MQLHIYLSYYPLLFEAILLILQIVLYDILLSISWAHPSSLLHAPACLLRDSDIHNTRITKASSLSKYLYYRKGTIHTARHEVEKSPENNWPEVLKVDIYLLETTRPFALKTWHARCQWYWQRHLCQWKMFRQRLCIYLLPNNAKKNR